MAKKKYRAASAVLSRLFAFVFAAFTVLPGLASFVPQTTLEPFFADDKTVVFDTAEQAETPLQTEVIFKSQVLAAVDTMTAPVPESKIIPVSLLAKSLDSEELFAKQMALRQYRAEKKEQERIRLEQKRLEQERLQQEFLAPYEQIGITLPFDSLYSVSYQPTEEEYRMLCYVVQGEAGPSFFQEAVMVCEVIFNRVASERFSDDLKVVLTSPNQFNAYSGYEEAEDFAPSDDVTRAVQYVLSGKAPDLVKGSVYFCDPATAYHMDWFNTLDLVLEIENYRFYK